MEKKRSFLCCAFLCLSVDCSVACRSSVSSRHNNNKEKGFSQIRKRREVYSHPHTTTPHSPSSFLSKESLSPSLLSSSRTNMTNNMSIHDIDALCSRMYGSADRQARSELEAIAASEANRDGSLYTRILQESLNQFSLMFCAQSVVTWFKASEKQFSMQTKQEIVLVVIDAIRRLRREDAPKHIIAAVATAVAKISKLGCESEPLLLAAVHEALFMLMSSNRRPQTPPPPPPSSVVQSPSAQHRPSTSSTSAAAGSSSDQFPIFDGPSLATFFVSTAAGTLPSSSYLSSLQPCSADSVSVDAENFRLALQLLNALVAEFNLYDSSKQQTYMNFASHRRRSANFKDAALQSIFAYSLMCLECIHPDTANQEISLCSAAAAASSSSSSNVRGIVPLRAAATSCAAEITLLVRNCMTYDFMAIIVDETEDALSAQFPTTWKELLLSQRCLQTLWTQHQSLQYPHCVTLLGALGSICGIRRSFFDHAEEKVNFLDLTMRQLSATESNQDGRLSVPHYCSVLADCVSKFVAPFGYKDLASTPSFELWIRFVERLSSSVFRNLFGQDGTFATTSTLLQFWGRVANSKRMYLGDEDRQRDLEEVIPPLAVSFFASRITPWSGVDLDDELSEAVLIQADAFPALILLDPATILPLLHAELQRIGPAVLSTPSSCGWLFYLAGSIIRSVFQAVEESCADACSYFLLFVVECANRRREVSTGATGAFHDFTESAILHFLSAAHSILGSSRQTAVVAKILTNVFEDRTKLFRFVLFTVGHNITRDPLATQTQCGDAVAVVRASIDLIGESCRDVPMSLMQELRMELPPVVQLPLSQYLATYKLRTNLYAALWQLRFHQSNYETAMLNTFLEPVHMLMQSTVSGGMTDPLFIAGWLRDLRGVARGTSSNTAAFTDFVDWVLDRSSFFTAILDPHRSASNHHGSGGSHATPNTPPPVVTISLLRFLSELVSTGRYGKVNLPTAAHCASGLMLFKFVCQMLQDTLAVAITDELLQQVTGGSMPDGVYRYLLKPLCLSVDIMRKCLHGDFVPFGAMQLYNDPVFDVTVVGMFRMLRVFPMDLFRQYSKCTLTVVDLLRSMTEYSVISPLARMSGDEVGHAIHFCVAVCSDVESSTAVLLHGMSFLSFIAQLVGTVKTIVLTSPAMGPSQNGIVANGGHFDIGDAACSTSRSSTAQPRSSRRLREAIAKTLVPHTDLWPMLIHTAMNIVVCQDRGLSLCSSVVFPIFEADPNFWYQFSTDFVASYPAAKQQAVQEALSALSSGGDTQEKFFSEIFLFRNKVRNL